MSKKYQVWECRIYGPASAKIPADFDNQPRSAAQRAIESAGIEIIANFSGWAGTPQEREVAFIENRLPVPQADRIEQLETDRIEQLEADLAFVERWAVHHGTKPHMTAEQALSCIQHYPAIKAITKGYVDGKVPDTFDPYSRIEHLERVLVQAQKALLWPAPTVRRKAIAVIDEALKENDSAIPTSRF